MKASKTTPKGITRKGFLSGIAAAPTVPAARGATRRTGGGSAAEAVRSALTFASIFPPNHRQRGESPRMRVLLRWSSAAPAVSYGPGLSE